MSLYNLQTNNRFVFLDDENEENIDLAPASLKESNKAEKKAVASSNSQKATRGRVDQKPNRDGRHPGDTRPVNTFPKAVNMSSDETFAAKNEDRPARGGRGNLHGPSPSNVGNRPNDFNSRPPKREYERRSGSDKSGVKAHDKRDGIGSHNWGNSVKDFTTEALAPPADGESDENKDNEDKIGTDGDCDATPKKSDEPVVISLDEYLKNKPRVQADVMLRKPGEGEGTFSGKIGKKLNPEKFDDDDEEIEVLIREGCGRQKQKLDIVFGSQQHQRGGRGGRGAARGFGGARGGRGGYQRNDSEQLVFDDSAFPSLKAS